MICQNGKDKQTKQNKQIMIAICIESNIRCRYKFQFIHHPDKKCAKKNEEEEEVKETQQQQPERCIRKTFGTRKTSKQNQFEESYSNFFQFLLINNVSNINRKPIVIFD